MAAKLEISGLIGFIGREVAHENRQIEQLRNSNLEDLTNQGEVLGPLKVVGRSASGDLLLRATGIYFSRFRSGDTIELIQLQHGTTRAETRGSTTKIRSVLFPLPGTIEIVVPGRNVSSAVGTELFAFPKSMAGIKSLISRKLKDFAHNSQIADRNEIDRIGLLNGLSDSSEVINATQANALRFIIENDLNGIVQGPPGTGKTKTLVTLIQIAISRGLRVGLGCLSHAAVDNALAQVLKSGVSVDRCVRIASDASKVSTGLYSPIDPSAFVERSLSTCETHYQLYAATMHSWMLSGSTPNIDVLIVDEASQVPIYFQPYLAKLSARVVMFGDHQQLPPVIQASSSMLPADDIFSYGISGAEFPMLDTQYRMNENIQDWSSKRFYHGRLQPHESARGRDILTDRSLTNPLLSGGRVNLISHQGRSSFNANPTEASLVAEIVAGLNGQGGLDLSQIGIVSPHRAHAGAICAKLQEKLGLEDARKVIVDTVERFQGQEREAMVFSFGVERDNSKRGAKAFLGDGRRLNVAVTRARSRFYCLASSSLISQMRSLDDHNDLADFLSWCNGRGSSAKGRSSA
jgi:DNA replication ATP-dependent helicase Dna2